MMTYKKKEPRFQAIKVEDALNLARTNPEDLPDWFKNHQRYGMIITKIEEDEIGIIGSRNLAFAKVGEYIYIDNKLHVSHKPIKDFEEEFEPVTE